MDINKLVILQKEMVNAETEDGIFTIDKDGIFTTLNKFKEHFNTYSFQKRGCIDYPYEMFTLVDGVKFYCIITLEKYEELQPVDELINQFENKIAELKAKKEVTV